jgi:FeS assembly SUF system protein
MDKIFEIEQKIVSALKDVYDPEIPINIYDLGLVYKIDIDEELNVDIDMTLTAPNCPMADELVDNVRVAIRTIDGVKAIEINIVFDPPWSKDLLSDEAKLELGLL